MSTDEKVPPRDSVRTFVAASLREALQQIRQELGPDALILSQRPMGTRFAVEACLELPQESVSIELPPVPEAHVARGDSGTETAPASIHATMHEQAESNAIELDNSVEKTEHKPHWNLAGLGEQLSNLGYKHEEIRAFPNCQQVEEFRRSLTTHLNYAHLSTSQLTGCYRFIGAAGTGKSTTIIKLLAQWLNRQNPRDAIVISSDQEHLAGTEALSLACQMMNVTFHECAPQDLSATIKSYSRKSLILVDTPAMSARLSAMPIPEVNNIWVCSALHSVTNLQAQHKKLSTLGLAGIALTQLDQNSVGDDLASLLYHWRLPLYWLGTGSALPGDLHTADAQMTYKNLFESEAHAPMQIAV